MEDFEDQFFLDDDENYDKICGEVMLTTKKKLVIFCTICEAKYQGFEDYINHVFLNHETTESEQNELEEKPDTEEMSSSELWEEFIECSDEATTIELEIESLGSDALKKTELPIKMSNEEVQNVQKSSESNTQNTSFENVGQKIQAQMPQIQKASRNDDEFVIPSEIREVKIIKHVRKVYSDEERKHKCPICGLGFKLKYNLRYHFKRHSNDRKHECPECGKKFYEYAEVKAHRRLHSSKREYVCETCGRAFRTNHQLTSHIKRHKNQRDYKCQNCDKAFFDNVTLQAHIRSHTLERPFFCKTCNATFARITALQNHVKLHENKRQYKCNLCDSAFNQAAGLFSHMRITHKAA